MMNLTRTYCRQSGPQVATESAAPVTDQVEVVVRDGNLVLGTFAFQWRDHRPQGLAITPELHLPDGAWRSLFTLSHDLVEQLERLAGQQIDPTHLTQVLDRLGFQDLTDQEAA